MSIKKSPTRTDRCPLVQQSVSKNSTRKECVGRAISHVCGLPPLSQHPVRGLGIIASGIVDPFLNIQHLHTLLPKQVSHQLWCIYLIFYSYKLWAHHKTPCIYPRSWPCVKHSSQTGHRLSSVKNSRGSSSDTIHLLLNSQEKPELPNSSIMCFCWSYHTEEHMDYKQVCSVALSSQDYISPFHLFKVRCEKSFSFQQSPPGDAYATIKLFTVTSLRAQKVSNTCIKSPHMRH